MSRRLQCHPGECPKGLIKSRDEIEKEHLSEVRQNMGHNLFLAYKRAYEMQLDAHEGKLDAENVKKKTQEIMDMIYDEGRVIHHSWDIQDVLDQAKRDGHTLSDDEAKIILQDILNQVNSDVGINWCVISIHIENMVNNRI